MLSQQLIYAEDNDGMIGWMLCGINPDADLNAAWDGRLIAHDILEHVNGPAAIGTVEDELEALGAAAFVRDIDIRWDVQYLFEDEIVPLEDIDTVSSHLMDDIFGPMLEDISKSLDKELPSEKILAYLYRGYDKAEAKYNHPSDAYCMFTNIEGCINNIEVDEVNLGLKITLYYDENITYYTKETNDD